MKYTLNNVKNNPHNFFSFFIKYRFQFFLLLISLVIFATNYIPNTYLTGWDNLQTEFNPNLGVKRAFFGVWQEYQSFGLVSGLAHASDLIRSLFISFISLFLKQNIIRYIYHILMLLIGSLGMFTFLNYLKFNDKNVITFVASVFYMLNFGVIQLFYVPYEPFSTFFAILPWEIWIFVKLLDNKNRQNFLLFLLINALATPQAYIQTLFVVYILVLLCFVLGKALQERSFSIMKRSFVLFLLIFMVNSFWILPQIYFLKTQGKVIKEAKINQLATDDLYYQNREKGTFSHFLKMEGFYYDLLRSDQKQLFIEWKDHFNKPYTKILQHITILVIFLGFLSRRKNHLSFLFIYVFSCIALLNATIPFSLINDLIRQNNIVDQIFRTPFTKFVIPYALISSYFFASGINLISKMLNKLRFMLSKNNIAVIFLIIVCLYSLPSFKGLFFSPSMKVTVPKEYIELIDYFKKIDKDKRIALLPEHTFWGWFFNKWGYNGSGFLWYGVEQPIVSRTFDVWSDKSEGYFWEIKSALEAENTEDFEKVLEKYNIDYLIFDLSFLPVNSNIKGLQYDRLKTMLYRSKKIKLTKQWKNISVYEVGHNKKIKNFISMASDLPNIGPYIKVTNKDFAYLNYKDYKTDSSTEFQYYFPFLDLMTQTKINNKTWNINENQDNFIFSKDIEFDLNNFYLANKVDISKENIIFNKQSEINNSKVSIKLTDNKIIVSIPKNLILDYKMDEAKFYDCGLKKSNNNFQIDNSIYVKSEKGGSICFAFNAPLIEQRYGYLIKINSQNISGRKLFFYILDATKKQGYVEARLDNGTEYFLLSPRYRYGLGYSFNFQNNSYENLVSSNLINELQIYSIPTDDVKSLVLNNNNQNVRETMLSDSFTTKKNTYYSYSIDSLITKPGTIILNQSYHDGWNAYINGKKIKNHVLVNNWANGWVLDENAKGDVKIVFWPQYLEYFGFFLVFLAFVWVLTRKNNA